MPLPARLKLCAIAAALAVACATNAPLAQAQAGTPLYDASVRALRNTQLNYPDSAPFHAKISVTDSHPDTNRSATIEMWWMSPTKYRRVIESPDYSQTRIVNGDAVSEENKGAYYPYWLQEVVDGFFDAIPFLPALQKLPATLSTNPPAYLEWCGDVHMRVDRWMVCFQKDHKDQLQSVFTKGFFVEFKDYQKFANKRVAHKIVTEQDREHEIDSVITVLNRLDSADDSLFAVAAPTPAPQQIRSVQVSEDDFRKLVIGSMDVAWPTNVVGGLAKGGCGVFVSVDREGTVRESRHEGCDNFALEEPLRLAALKWKLHPASINGAPVQVTALLGIPYDIHVEPAPEIITLSEADALKLASNKTQPEFPVDAKRGTIVSMEVTIDDDGRFVESTSPKGTPTYLSVPIALALEKWKFTPYLKDGKPVPFKFTVSFAVP
jgi:hypothetical protein